jgi:nucleotide-binding universal stress UspA family protein
MRLPRSLAMESICCHRERRKKEGLTMLTIKSILHPTDFSEWSKAGFALACALARDYKARLVLLHVARQPLIAPFVGAGPPEPENYHQELASELAKLRAKAAGLEVEDRLAFSDNPAAEIARSARQLHCDLIVMGTHGRTGLGRMLMGSVAEGVSRKASCPVLTVKLPGPVEGMEKTEPRHASETVLI